MYKRRFPYKSSQSQSAVKRFRPFRSTTKWSNAIRSIHPAGPKKTGTLKTQVRSLQRVVKKILPEIKYADTALDTTDITSSTGAVIHISGVAQDDTATGRSGNTIQIQSLTLSGFFLRSSSVAYIPNAMYRIVIVCDKQQVGDTAPTIGDVFDYGASNSTRFLPKLSVLERFRVLYVSKVFDAEMMALQQTLTTSGSGIPTMSTYFQFTKKMNLKVDYNGTASTDIQKNGLYFMVLSNDTGNAVDINGIARIGFVDA